MRAQIKKLQEIGCEIVIVPPAASLQDERSPFLALCVTEHFPTDYEVSLLSELLVRLARAHGAHPGANRDRGAQPVTVRKTPLGWEYIQPDVKIRATWKRISDLQQIFLEF